jgi:DNA-binding NtrC family response regulator
MNPPLTTRIVESGPGRLELDAAELHVVAGPDRGVQHALSLHSVSIGSDPHCDLVLHDSTVSSRHAEVMVTASGYTIRDLGSKNGVMLAQWRVERAPLADGMRLAFGKSTIEVRALGGVHNIALTEPGALTPLVTASVKMRAIAAMLRELAPADITVLLEGESGTGKEVAAEALHRASRRAQGPFVVFDCGATPRSLIAAELFGHERGAFSGADVAREGAFERADGGTLFLDEIGELPLDVQPVLLRVAERKSVRRLGGSRDVNHDVRIVAATNRNLHEEVRAGRFREDLFHRLAAARVRLPPLRERVEDIPLLAHRFAAELGGAVSPELEALLLEHRWPGNVRELRNTIARVIVLGTAAFEVPRAHGSEPLASMPEARRDAMSEFERLYVIDALARSGGNISEAARLAGVSRQIMTRLTARYGLRAKDR